MTTKRPASKRPTKHPAAKRLGFLQKPSRKATRKTKPKAKPKAKSIEFQSKFGAQGVVSLSFSEALETEILGILREMKEILVVRGATYADIDENSERFRKITAGLGLEPAGGMTPTVQHCLSNISTKLARLSSSGNGQWGHEDSWIDLANYAILALASLRRARIGRPVALRPEVQHHG